MVKIPEAIDPTLAAVDRELEARNQWEQRHYLGMSGIGDECERKLWYNFHWVSRIQLSALSIKRIADGHAGEKVQATRLRMVNGIVLWTIDPDTGKQFEFEDLDGHFGGHKDGAILGLIQASKTWHVWEHKQVDEKSVKELHELKIKLGEKSALRAWDFTYYCQAIMYMHYSGFKRHYLTCSSPGGRNTISVRTEYNEQEALRLIAKARRIITAPRPLPRQSNDPSFYRCQPIWCDHRDTCHFGALPLTNCRTCMHSTPAEGAKWHCALWNRLLDKDEQKAGCPKHLFNPNLIADKQVDADANGEWIEYQRKDGSTWRDGVTQ